jgi:hypothetical protein
VPNRVISDLHRPDAAERDAKAFHAGLNLALEASHKDWLFALWLLDVLRTKFTQALDLSWDIGSAGDPLVAFAHPDQIAYTSDKCHPCD